jgi:hypothetical protein
VYDKVVLRAHRKVEGRDFAPRLTALWKFPILSSALYLKLKAFHIKRITHTQRFMHTHAIALSVSDPLDTPKHKHTGKTSVALLVGHAPQHLWA